MSKIKLNKTLKRIINNKKLIRTICTNAEIDTTDGIIKLKTNGVPCLISIHYEGLASFTNMLPIYFKVISGTQKIIINNLFRRNVPETLFSYVGDIEIKGCVIISQDGSKLPTSIKNTKNLDFLNKSETNLDDDTLILFEEEADYNRPKTREYGVKPRKIYPSFNSQGKVQKYGKKEVEEISSIITEIVPSLSFSKEDRDRIPKKPVILKESYRQEIDKLGGKTPEGDKIRYGDVQGNFKKYRK